LLFKRLYNYEKNRRGLQWYYDTPVNRLFTPVNNSKSKGTNLGTNKVRIRLFGTNKVRILFYLTLSILLILTILQT